MRELTQSITPEQAARPATHQRPCQRLGSRRVLRVPDHRRRDERYGRPASPRHRRLPRRRRVRHQPRAQQLDEADSRHVHGRPARLQGADGDRPTLHLHAHHTGGVLRKPDGPARHIRQQTNEKRHQLPAGQPRDRRLTR